MPQADVFALVDDFAGTRSDTVVLADATARARYYADVVYEHGLNREGACDASFVATLKGTAVYTQPTAAIRTLALMYDDKQLRTTARRALEAYDANWRARLGRPTSVTTQDQDIHTMRLVPVPDVDGDAIGVTTPFDAVFPGDVLTFIFTENVTDVLPWDEMWVALEVLSREFGRESDHYDTTLSKLARQLAAMLRVLVGYDG